jgi:hypothetical protein
MKAVQAIIFAFIAVYICGDLNVPAPWDVIAVGVSACVGYLIRAINDQDEREALAQAALARDQRQARLNADAAAERDARQQLGEF